MGKNGKGMFDILAMTRDNKNRFNKSWLMGYLSAARIYGGLSDDAYEELFIYIMNLDIKD